MATHAAKLASLTFKAKDWKIPDIVAEGPNPQLKEWLKNPCADLIKDDPFAETFVKKETFAKWYGADLAKGKDLTTFTFYDHATQEMVVETKQTQMQKISASEVWKASFKDFEKLILSELHYMGPTKDNSGPLSLVKEEFVAWLQSLPAGFDFKRDTLNWLQENCMPIHSSQISLSAWCPFAVYARHKLKMMVCFAKHGYSTDGGRTQYPIPAWVSRFIYQFDKAPQTALPSDCLDICKTI